MFSCQLDSYTDSPSYLPIHKDMSTAKRQNIALKFSLSTGVQDNEVLAEDQDFDFIAKVLYNHPAIQAVMANNL